MELLLAKVKNASGRIGLFPFKNSLSPTLSCLCPVLVLHDPFAEPSISFMHVFRTIIVANLIDNYDLVKFSVLRVNFLTANSSCPVSHTVS